MNLKALFKNAWFRVFSPLVLLGVSAVSTNLIAWDITKDGTLNLRAALTSYGLWCYILSSLLFFIIEFRISKEQTGPAGFYNDIMDELKNAIIAHGKDLINQGRPLEAFDNINASKKIFKSQKY